MSYWARNIKNFILLNYIEHVLILNFLVTEYASISTLATLVDIPIGIKSSGIE